MCSKQLAKAYFCSENRPNRISDLIVFGQTSSLFFKPDPCPGGKFVIEIYGKQAVSKPCWEELTTAADFYDSETVFLDDFKFAVSFPLVPRPEQIKIYTFQYTDKDLAENMELRVRSSARDRRKGKLRRERIDEAGGFHTKEVIDALFGIQGGKCYYTGDRLENSPKNYSVDHLLPIYLGGSGWPENLALVLTAINLKKGGLAKDKEIIEMLAATRGWVWYKEQLDFMEEVDEKRQRLSHQFRKQQKQ